MNENEIDKRLEQISEKAGAETKGERFYARKLVEVYKTVRPSLVAINQARKAKYEGGSKGKKGNLVKEAELTNEEAVDMVREILQEALDSLEE